MPLISVNNLSCIKRDRTLFEQLNFELFEGDIVHLKGENGAGKTSLIRILAGLAAPSNGQLFFLDKPLDDSKEIFAQRSLYLGHKSSTSEALTPMENTKFWLAQQGISLTSTIIDDVFMQMGLAGFEDVPVGMLSAGQSRRVALSRLWFKYEASVWLLDEPFTALDVKGIALINKKIDNFTNNGGAVIVTSHQTLQTRDKPKEWQLEYRF